MPIVGSIIFFPAVSGGIGPCWYKFIDNYEFDVESLHRRWQSTGRANVMRWTYNSFVDAGFLSSYTFDERITWMEIKETLATKRTHSNHLSQFTFIKRAKWFLDLYVLCHLNCRWHCHCLIGFVVCDWFVEARNRIKALMMTDDSLAMIAFCARWSQFSECTHRLPAKTF